jgi:hypothetical protein
MCCRLVSGFLTDVTQQIHSLRASGVRSFQASRTPDEEAIAFRKSVGTVCTTPVAILFFVITPIHASKYIMISLVGAVGFQLVSQDFLYMSPSFGPA